MNLDEKASDFIKWRLIWRRDLQCAPGPIPKVGLGILKKIEKSSTGTIILNFKECVFLRGLLIWYRNFYNREYEGLINSLAYEIGCAGLNSMRKKNKLGKALVTQLVE